MAIDASVLRDMAGAKPSPVDVSAPRVVSIDIFRGITMSVMIFVNALSSVPGLPWWTYHAPAKIDEMTYVDMVFPFFLFIVGMSLPLSIRQRLKRNPSILSLWAHVIERVASLLVLGLILANAEKADPTKMILNGNVWALLALVSAALYLNVYPTFTRFPALPVILRFSGLAGVILLFAMFRRAAPDGHAAWIDFSYPEILGLIAISYLAVAVLFIPSRRVNWAPAAWFAVLAALCAVSTAKLWMFPNNASLYVWPFGNGAMPCIIMGGVITSSIFPSNRVTRLPRRAIVIAVGFGLLTLLAAWVLTPLGISKIRATPTWSLYSVGAAVLIFTLLYWVCDVNRRTDWAYLFRPAGSNTLLTYLLPDVWYFLLASLSITYLDSHLSTGWPAILKTVAFTLFILAASGVLTKAKIRLRL